MGVDGGITRQHRDLSVEEAIELGQRSIFHATFRDAVSGGTASGVWGIRLSYAMSFAASTQAQQARLVCIWFTTTTTTCTVYHVTEKGWTKVRGGDVGELFFDYFPKPEMQAAHGKCPLDDA